MNTKKYWEIKHKKYAKEDWINKPTIFAQFASRYFSANGKILDLGSGQGQDSRYFARNGYEVVATDFSGTALKFLKEKMNEEKINITIKNVDLSDQLPFANFSFEVVYSHLSLHYFNDKTTKLLFDEILRVLKRGGVFATLLNTLDDPEVKQSEKLESGLYKTPTGLIKRFFTVDYLNSLVIGDYKIIVLDSKGKTYKDEIKTLIRFVGRKI